LEKPAEFGWLGKPAELEENGQTSGIEIKNKHFILTFPRGKNNAEKTSGFDPKKKKQTLFFCFSQRTSGPPENQRIFGKTSGNRKNKRALRNTLQPKK